MELAYRLFDGEGDLVEESEPGEPLRATFGVGQLSPELERALDGLPVGGRRRVRLRPDQAFGARDDQAILVVERDELPPDAAVGDQLEAEDERGEVVFLRVLELDEQEARLDANHPLAGQQVELELSVLDARPASAGELAEAARLRDQSSVAPDVSVQSLLASGRRGASNGGGGTSR